MSFTITLSIVPLLCNCDLQRPDPISNRSIRIVKVWLLRDILSGSLRLLKGSPNIYDNYYTNIVVLQSLFTFPTKRLEPQT